MNARTATIPTDYLSLSLVQVYVFIRMKCDEGRSISIKVDSLDGSCAVAQKGSMMVPSMKFTTREDIDHEQSFCKTSRNGEECVLVKKSEHIWDRLTEDANELKGIAKIDWVRQILMRSLLAFALTSPMCSRITGSSMSRKLRPISSLGTRT
jgi:hypothetical protein